MSSKAKKILLPVLGIFALGHECFAQSQLRADSSPIISKISTNRSMVVEPFSLRDVVLLDSPFKAAMERNAKYLLLLDADRLLHNTRKYAGFTPKGELYGGWESRGIAGHTLGHYLTALAQQYAATGDVRFQQRIAYIIKEMAECQQAYGDGYIGALPPNELATLRGFKQGKVELSGGFNFKGGAWVPWYTQHKVLAGLKDAWTLGGNEQAKAVTLKLADWIDDVTRNLTPEQVQRMLQVEHGGMNETFADIYALTGDKKYLEVSRRFYHKDVLDPLAEGRDNLQGKHANTQIPKVIGEARLYEVASDEKGRRIAESFWDSVVHHHSYVIGGNSEYEHFGPPDQLASHLGAQTAETCNSYNMLKLTRHLFEWEPKAEYFDFYERVLYNHILASQEPKRGMFTYFMSLKPGHVKTFSTEFDSFWCCVGSGMENHTKYNDSIYFHNADELYVNLFIPSHLNWKQKGVVLEQKSDYPNSNKVEFRVKAATRAPFALKVRCPQWATGGLKLELNGKALPIKSVAGSYAAIRRTWKQGDVLKVTIPMAVRNEAMPDAPDKKAFIYGPVVLAGDLGTATETDTYPYSADHTRNDHKPTVDVPVLVSENAALNASVKRSQQDGLVFLTSATGNNKVVKLRPFNEIFYDHYNVYWDVLTPTQYAERKAALEVELNRQKALDARTLDEFRPGEQQSEIDHNLQGENSSSGQWRERKFRHAENGGWFSFDVKIDPEKPVELLVSYWGGESGQRTFDVLVDKTVIATQSLRQDKPNEFFEKTYAVPEELTRGKQSINVRFQAHPGNIAGGVFAVRALKR